MDILEQIPPESRILEIQPAIGLASPEAELSPTSLLQRAYLGTTALVQNVRQDMGDFYQAGKEDFIDASLPKRIAVTPVVGLSAAAMAIDIPFHEAYIAKVGTRVFRDSGGGTFATGRADMLASLGVEGLIAAGVLVGVKAMPKLTEAISKKFMRKGSEGDGSELGGVGSVASFAYFYGSGATVFRRNKEKNRGNIAKNVLTALGAVAFLGAVNLATGSGAAELADLGLRHPGTPEHIANFSVDVLKSTTVWLGIIASRIVIKKNAAIRKMKKQAESDKAELQEVHLARALERAQDVGPVFGYEPVAA